MAIGSLETTRGVGGNISRTKYDQQQGNRLFRSVVSIWGVLVLVWCMGCAHQPYRYGATQSSLLPKDSLLSPVILIGGPVPAMDQMERIVNYPQEAIKKVAPKSPVSGATSQDALLAAVAYLEDNDLHEVIVEAHHYDPEEQWKRLRANPSIHPGWKYTDGLARVWAYTCFPPRLYRMDTYNPYTKTLSINSSNPASAIYEAAKAKNAMQVTWPGAYAAMRYVPLAPLGQQAMVTQDALGYVRENADPDIEKGMVAYTMSNMTGAAFLGGATIAPQLNDVPLVSVPASRIVGNATGNVAGRLIASSKRLQRREETSGSNSLDLMPKASE